ncbi:MAG TPA: hypothetical protein VF337_01385 [Candidatus Limnocylindrales bacterium]
MSLLAVMGVGAIEIWFGVPTGFAMGLPVPAVWLMTVAGSFASVTLVAFAGDALRSRLMRRFGKGGPPRSGRIYSVWLRYGVPGWGLASPLFMTPPMGTGVALMLGAPRRQLLLWMYAGVLLWVTILVSAAVVGLELVQGIH